MFKTIVIAALGFAAVSAQFLDVRNLQNSTANATTTTAAPTLTPTAFSAACAVSATGVETGCNTAGYCCAAYNATGTALAATVPKSVCVPTDFIGSTFTIAGTNYAFTRCLSANVTAAATVRTTCAADAECGTAQCCANITLQAGTSAAPFSAARRFCTAGTAAPLTSSTYVAASWAAGYVARSSAAACTPNAAPVESFGAYIKASVMMVFAVLSVALF
jgi:hypothetical protein